MVSVDDMDKIKYKKKVRVVWLFNKLYSWAYQKKCGWFQRYNCKSFQDKHT